MDDNITGRRKFPSSTARLFGRRPLQTAIIRAQPFTRCAAVPGMRSSSTRASPVR
jgi:hypothetical protein